MLLLLLLNFYSNSSPNSYWLLLLLQSSLFILGDQYAGTTGRLDLLLGALAEEAGLDDERLGGGQATLAEHFSKALYRGTGRCNGGGDWEWW